MHSLDTKVEYAHRNATEYDHKFKLADMHTDFTVLHETSERWIIGYSPNLRKLKAQFNVSDNQVIGIVGFENEKKEYSVVGLFESMFTVENEEADSLYHLNPLYKNEDTTRMITPEKDFQYVKVVTSTQINFFILQETLNTLIQKSNMRKFISNYQ